MGEAVVAAHSNADPDAVGSLIVVGRILAEYGVEACAYIPEGPSRASKSIIVEAGVKLGYCEGVEEPRNIVVVDSANPSQLGILAPWITRANVVLIDHHEPGGLAEIARLAIVDSGAASTSEILGVISRELSIPLTPGEASMGLTGIVYDTRRFRLIGEYTFEAAAYYSSRGGRIIEVEAGEAEYPERYARVKAASRARISRICRDLVLAVTHVGSYESSAARALLDVGADVVLVVGGSGEARRVSVRVSRRAAESGVYAGDLARFVAEKLGGEGGGHREAGMAHLPPRGGDPSNIADEIYRSVQGKAARLCTRARSTSNVGGGVEE